MSEQQVTEDEVYSALRKCMDPEIPVNIVELGLVYGVQVRAENNNVDIKMTMTTRGCPLHDTLVNDVKRYVNKVPGVADVNIEIVWDPPWTPEKMSDEGKKLINYGKQQTIAPINYETAMPQGKGSL